MIQSQYQRFDVCARVHALTPQRCASHDLFSRRGWQRRTRGAAGWSYWDARCHVPHSVTIPVVVEGLISESAACGMGDHVAMCGML